MLVRHVLAHTAVGYHSLTQGYLVGELVRRITGRRIGDFFATEVAGPLDAHFRMVVSVEHDGRVALTIPPAGRGQDYAAGSSATDAPATGGTPMTVRDANSVAWRRSEIPAASGFGNARSVALIQSVMACGGTLGDLRLLDPETCELAWAEQFSGEDRVLGMPVSWGLGYGRLGGAYGWEGWGGALVMIDPTRQLVVAYATNQMREPAQDSRGLQVAMAALAVAQPTFGRGTSFGQVSRRSYAIDPAWRRFGLSLAVTRWPRSRRGAREEAARSPAPSAQAEDVA